MSGEISLDPSKEGTFRAVIASFNVKDSDGDVTLPGAFKAGAPVRIAQYAHNWRAPTIGAGILGADNQKAWVDGTFNLKMLAGREHYESVKFDWEHAKQQEYSYGYDPEDAAMGQHEGEDVRFLKALKVHEVSPCMLGAGVGTGTEDIKAAGLSFSDHATETLASLQALLERAHDIKALRAKEGRTLSTANRTRLTGLVESLRSGMTDLETLLRDTQPASEDGKTLIEGIRLRMLADEARAAIAAI